jgi:mannose-1-phosphate guanylyltransferase
VARPRIHAVILAGGAGERFWPASRSAVPKPFLRVLGKHTLLDATVARAQRVATRERVWVVCGEEHERAIRAATRLPAARVLVEPQRRNTAAAVAFAALRVAAADPDAVMLVLPADHYIPDVRAFTASARSAAQGRARGARARDARRDADAARDGIRLHRARRRGRRRASGPATA